MGGGILSTLKDGMWVRVKGFDGVEYRGFIVDVDDFGAQMLIVDGENKKNLPEIRKYPFKHILEIEDSPRTSETYLRWLCDRAIDERDEESFLRNSELLRKFLYHKLIYGA